MIYPFITSLRRLGLFFPLIFFCLSCSKPNPLDQLDKEVREIFSATEGEFALAFRRLDYSQTSLLINERVQFHAASTMKVPVMIELFKQARQGKFLLSDTIIIKNEFKSIVDGSPYSLDVSDDSGEYLYERIGEKATIYDLMFDMITVSSNLATNILIEMVEARIVTETMRNLGAEDIMVLRGVEDQKAYEQGLSNSTTALDLLLIMQSIASQETADDQKMIEILKAQKFNEIIPHLLPKNVEVAHKTGVITALHHDAGIVYLPNGDAYVLVLLSKNLGDFDVGTEKMAEISKLVYDYMSSNP